MEARRHCPARQRRRSCLFYTSVNHRLTSSRCFSADLWLPFRSRGGKKNKQDLARKEKKKPWMLSVYFCSSAAIFFCLVLWNKGCRLSNKESNRCHTMRDPASCLGIWRRSFGVFLSQNVFLYDIQYWTCILLWGFWWYSIDSARWMENMLWIHFVYNANEPEATIFPSRPEERI